MIVLAQLKIILIIKEETCLRKYYHIFSKIVTGD